MVQMNSNEICGENELNVLKEQWECGKIYIEFVWQMPSCSNFFSVIYLICMWSFGLVFFYSYEVLFGFIDRFWDQLKKHHEFSKMA